MPSGDINTLATNLCTCALCRTEPPSLHWQLLPQYARELAAEEAERVPNRLYGVTINHEGNAV